MTSTKDKLFPVLVRAVHSGDFSEWCSLWESYNAFYGQHGDTALPDDITKLTWRRFFDPDEPVHALVAERGGRLVGLTHYLFHRSTTQEEPICYLRDLFTLESERRGGVGRALIEGVYRKAKAAGAKNVYWQTHVTNTVGRFLYEKLAENEGFIVYSHEL